MIVGPRCKTSVSKKSCSFVELTWLYKSCCRVCSYLMKMFANASVCLSLQKYIVQIQSEMNFTAPCKAGVPSYKEEHSSIIVLLPVMLLEAIRCWALC